jgi:hypothetical protein
MADASLIHKIPKHCQQSAILLRVERSLRHSQSLIHFRHLYYICRRKAALGLRQSWQILAIPWRNMSEPKHPGDEEAGADDFLTALCI